MLWNSIYDFFATYIFGGYDTSNRFHASKISLFYIEDDALEGEISNLNNVFFKCGIGYMNNDNYFSLASYFNTIFSIITIIAILLFCVFIIKKIIGIIFRLFTGSSAF